MAFITELRERVDTLAAVGCLDVEPADLPDVLAGLGADDVRRVMAETSVLVNDLHKLSVVAAGVIAQRSTREHGHTGMAATEGHRTATDLVQAITGGTRAEAARQVRLGTSIMDAAGEDARAALVDEPLDGAGVERDADGGAGETPRASSRWDDALRAALLDGSLTGAKHDAILRGLGAPPVVRDPASGGVGERAADDVVEAWGLAAAQLLDEATECSADDLLHRARILRDTLDPIGAEERAQARFEARSFRKWTDAAGLKRASLCLDDDGDAWFDALLDAGLRPRRGGPRFVADDEKVAATALVDDARTNEQLAYDLVLDVLRAGALARPEDVFGARQPGVRIVTVSTGENPRDLGPRDAFGRLLATAHLEDRGTPVAGSLLDRALCTNGHRVVSVDAQGDPLDLGREQRLYTTKQNIALAMRDGGCRWPGCCAPASYTESHHIDHWNADGGRTDIDRGILLCRFHHMLLHNQGWKITRDGKGEFVLHPPPGGGEPVVLRSRSAVRWAWDPPSVSGRSGWRAPPRPPGARPAEADSLTLPPPVPAPPPLAPV